MILETPRTLLRRLVREDLGPLASLYADPEVRRYFPEGTLSYEETIEELEWFLDGHPRHPELGLWATIDKASQRFIGRCGLIPWTIDGRLEVEVAYLLERAAWGQGLATEIGTALVQYAFQTLNLTRVICLIDPANLASIRVAEKLGMQFETDGEDDKGPYVLYALQRD